MKIEKIKKLLKSKHYDFLRVNEHLGSNIILLGLGGSHAYGTDTENSDLDIRGCALNKREEILIPIHNFDQVTEETTDTTIYSFNKLITLLSNCNPNTIELIGLKPEHYLYIHPIGQELLDNAEMFLSKKAIYSFGGYATSQLRRLDNKSARKLGQEERMQHVLNSIMNAFYTFPEKYFNFPEDAIKLYVDKGIQEDYETEVFMDIQLKHYPLNDYQGMWAEMKNIVADVNVNACVDRGDDEAAKVYLKEQQELNDKIDFIKSTLKEWKENADVQKEKVEVLQQQLNDLKAEKESAVLTLETAQASKAFNVTPGVSSSEEEKMLEKVRDGVKKQKEAADGARIAYESSTTVQKQRLDKKMKDDEIDKKLQELKAKKGK